MSTTDSTHCLCVITEDGVADDECPVHNAPATCSNCEAPTATGATLCVDCWAPINRLDRPDQDDREGMLLMALKDVERALPGTLARLRDWYAVADAVEGLGVEDGGLYDTLFLAAPPEGWLKAALQEHARYAI